MSMRRLSKPPTLDDNSTELNNSKMNNCRVNAKSTLAPTQQSYVDVGGANGYEATI